jgi:Hypothetical glycosyl hydrolase 6
MIGERGPRNGETRRGFLGGGALTAMGLAGLWHGGSAAAAPVLPPAAPPWYRRAVRWMQTNIAEIDVVRYDIPWWRDHWKRTGTQGIVVNAGGIVAFYPTRVPLHRRAELLGERDLFGELVEAAHRDGIAVFARMDSNGAADAVVQAHPDWFTRNPAGQPYRDRGLNVPCVNGPYYRTHIPAILREVATTYHPEGFTDNSWSGLGRNSICHCDNCRKKFRDQRGLDLPSRQDWNAPAYRRWIEWSYACRLEIWDLYNETTRAAGGPECLWVGMIGGTIAGAAAEFRDYRQICRRAEIIMLDNQRRTDATGFQANGQAGKLVHGLLGWDKLVPESMALYQSASANFRLAAKPEPEVRLWALDGFAGGIQPWWHYINAYHEDRRMYRTPTAMGLWQRKNEELLLRRQPVATVGIVYSQRNHDFFGRDEADLLVNLPQRGFTQALTRARIPYVFIHADDLERDAGGLRVLILANLGAMTDAQAAAIRAFVRRGGGLIASGASSLGDEWGDPRPDLALADVLGVRLPARHPLRDPATRRQWASESGHSYLRLTPELRAMVDGPHMPGEPVATGARHPVLRGFDETDILPYGGALAPVDLDPPARALLTFVPPIPIYPPEAVWSRNGKTEIAGLVTSERTAGGRVAYLAADLDRRYARDNLADHGNLLANLVRWTARDDFPLAVQGPGLLDCHLYRQPGRAIFHCVNLTNEGTWRAPIDELVPVGPLRVRMRLPDDVRGRRLRLLVSGQKPALAIDQGWARFEIASLLDHELAVVDG